jgi:hypothetical protein
VEDARLNAVDQGRLAGRYALQAVALLAKARAAGSLQNLAALPDLKKNPDFAPLRSREDFREFVRELEENKQAAGR